MPNVEDATPTLTWASQSCKVECWMSVIQEGPPLVKKVVITPAKPMKNHGCKWLQLGINLLIVVRGPHLVLLMERWFNNALLRETNG